MTRLVSGSSVPSQNTGGMKAQLSALFDTTRQVTGDALTVAGSSGPMDPLNHPFTLYVNPYIGSDRFVGGSYNSFEEPGGATDAEKIAAKLKRIENQRLVCGYSKERPFRTLNRAVIEIVLATSKSFFTINSEAANVDCPSVELSAGTHTIYNDPGNSGSAIAISEWPVDGFDPTPEHLIAFNPNSGGLVIPRYATVSSPLSLRQTVIRPSYVPPVADEAADYSNRSAIFKITSSGYVYGFSFRDAFGASSSHHLLDCFHNASQADLDQLYTKVRTALGGANATGNISNALAVTRPSEFQTVGPITGNPSEAWDTVKGASPYVYNCSLRTEWGMSGVFWDGARLTGLKSCVVAQFTGVNQQRDLSCWEIYRSGAWRAPVDYQELIDSESDDVRMKPRRMSRHITLANDAFGQMVSVFAIGPGRHHLADTGAQLEFSNSTSNFGGCVAVAKGYQTTSVALDTSWNLRRLKVARTVADQTGNIRRIPLGIVSAISSSTITLAAPLAIGSDPAVPAVLAASGHTLAAGTLVWIDNPTGADWCGTLSGSAWSSASPSAIAITAAAVQAGTGAAIGTGAGGASLAIGKRVYLRRVIDTRTTAQRRVTLRLSNTTSARTPLRNAILQTKPGVSGGGIDRVLAAGGAEVLAVTQTYAIPAEGSGVVASAEITIRRSCPDESYASGVFYRQGQTVKHGGKHWTAKGTFTSSGANPGETLWQESYVQQESAYNAEDPTTLEAPVLIFDTDTDSTTDTTLTCGINWSTIYTSAGSVRNQLRSATDYRGALALLLALGFTSTDAHAALLPRTEASRELDPANATHFPVAPTGGAASGRANWALEFRLPSFVQLLGHNFNGVGFWNYSRALPRARRQLSALNEFNANFAPEQGGRVEVRGINKDGFEVTNQGLINTDTGEVVSVEGIGAEGDQSLPTQLTDLSVENLSVSGIFDVGGVATLTGGEAIAMSTERYGLGQLASYEDVSTVTQAASDDAGLRSDRLLTLEGFNRIAANRRYVSASIETVIFYVDPVNGQGSTADRTAALDTLLTTPPVSIASAAKSLAFAADLASILYSASVAVEYRCLPGVYLDSDIVFKTKTRIRAWKADDSGPLYPLTSFGGYGFYENVVDPANRHDITKHVIFPTKLILNWEANSTVWSLIHSPVNIDAEENITIENVVIWGIHQSLYSTSIPGGFHRTTGASSSNGQTIDDWRTGQTFDDVYNNVLSLACRWHPAGTVNNLSVGPRASSFIVAGKSLRVQNVAVGAVCPVLLNTIDNNIISPLFSVGGDDALAATGLYFIGNARLTGNAAPGDGVTFGWKELSTAGGWEAYGHSGVAIGNGAGQSNLGIRLGRDDFRFEYLAGSTPAPLVYSGLTTASTASSNPTVTKDVPCNNIFMFSHAGGWDRAPSTNWKLDGPVFNAFLRIENNRFSDALKVDDVVVRLPFFEFNRTTNSGNYPGFKGACGSGLTTASPQGRFLTLGFLIGNGGNTKAIEFAYNSQLTDRTLTGTAVSPWRMAGPQGASNRMPRYNTPDGPGLSTRSLAVTFTGASTTVNATAHPLIVNDIVRFGNSGGALPVAINKTTDYYVVSIAADTFTVSATLEGAAITFATAGTGTHSVIIYSSYWPGMNIHTRSFRRGIDATATTNYLVGADYVL